MTAIEASEPRNKNKNRRHGIVALEQEPEEKKSRTIEKKSNVKTSRALTKQRSKQEK